MSISLPFLFTNKEDAYKTVTDIETERRLEEFEAARPSKGWERVKFVLFRDDEYGDSSPEVENIRFVTFTCGFAGAFYGGYKSSQKAYLEFVRTNQATAFDSHMEAKRRLQDRVGVSFLRGAGQLGWRTTLFGFMFATVTNVVALYRNKEGILEYTLGGLAAGMCYRLHVGLRGVIVGGILGGTLGTIGGVTANLLCYATGYTLTDVKRAQYAYSIERERSFDRAMDLSNREDQAEHTETPEVFRRIEEDESTGRIVDNLEEIEAKAATLSQVGLKTVDIKKP